MMRLSELERKAEQIQKETVRCAIDNKIGHLAPALSCLDILVALYYEVADEEDEIIVSKGHGGLAQLVIMADRGDISKESLLEYLRMYGVLTGGPHECVRHSTGTLGHGLPIAVGRAYARYYLERPGHIWVIVGDGEFEEGSCFEAVSLAGDLPFNFFNITILIDRNGFRAMDKTKAVPGFHGQIEGHNMNELVDNLKMKPPGLFSCMTIKGCGVPFMENDPKWHYRLPQTPEEISWIDSFLNSTPTTDTSSAT
jgi:transketolase